MTYNKGEFYLIKVWEHKELKSGQIIGEILKKIDLNIYLINIYVFPEDTKYQRQTYMSEYEVFLTSRQIKQEFTENMTKVEVVDLNNYINRKYINNEKIKYPLYFWRQFYSFDTENFNPENLPSICFCETIFNPDRPFKRCLCGEYFHLECLYQRKSCKCMDCGKPLLSVEEKLYKINAISNIIDEYKDEFIEEEEENNNLRQKNNETNFLEKYREDFEYSDEEENYPKNKYFQNSNYNINNKYFQLSESEDSKSDENINTKKNKIDDINREKGRNVIYSNLNKAKDIIINVGN